MLSVPYAMAAIAWAPPMLKTFVTPVRFAAYRIVGFIFPDASGGEHRIISLQPAILAGMASISTVENKGAEPPGMYIPTLEIGTDFLQHVTPGVVSTFELVRF